MITHLRTAQSIPLCSAGRNAKSITPDMTSNRENVTCSKCLDKMAREHAKEVSKGCEIYRKVVKQRLAEGECVSDADGHAWEAVCDQCKGVEYKEVAFC